MKPGRNEPCPCGSGRKYKNCHYAADAAARAAESTGTPSPVHELDERLVMDMLEFAGRRFRADVEQEAGDLATHPQMAPQLVGPWLVYVAEFEGRRLVDWYLEERGWSLSRGAKEWLEAQQRSWLSIWEVIAVEPGRSLTLHDLLTGEQRLVHEVAASKAASPLMMMLARVVDLGGVSYMCGSHVVPLRPMQAAAVVESVRKLLRRRTNVAPDLVRPDRVASRMLHAWSDEVDIRMLPPRLQNSDGDPILLTNERWTFRPEDRDDIRKRIEAIEGVRRDDEDRLKFVFVREGKRDEVTILGQLTVGEQSLLAFTNSHARADALRERVEEACRELIARQVREHSDPASVLARDDESGERADRGEMHEDFKVAASDANEAIRIVKERHYSDWVDQSIPALGGKTPRESSKTKRGREQLEALLKDIELRESVQPEATRFDVKKLRQALGIL